MMCSEIHLMVNLSFIAARDRLFLERIRFFWAALQMIFFRSDQIGWNELMSVDRRTTWARFHCFSWEHSNQQQRKAPSTMFMHTNTLTHTQTNRRDRAWSPLNSSPHQWLYQICTNHDYHIWWSSFDVRRARKGTKETTQFVSIARECARNESDNETTKICPCKSAAAKLRSHQLSLQFWIEMHAGWFDGSKNAHKHNRWHAEKLNRNGTPPACLCADNQPIHKSDMMVRKRIESKVKPRRAQHLWRTYRIIHIHKLSSRAWRTKTPLHDEPQHYTLWLESLMRCMVHTHALSLKSGAYARQKQETRSRSCEPLCTAHSTDDSSECQCNDNSIEIVARVIVNIASVQMCAHSRH